MKSPIIVLMGFIWVGFGFYFLISLFINANKKCPKCGHDKKLVYKTWDEGSPDYDKLPDDSTYASHYPEEVLRTLKISCPQCLYVYEEINGIEGSHSSREYETKKEEVKRGIGCSLTLFIVLSLVGTFFIFGGLGFFD